MLRGSILHVGVVDVEQSSHPDQEALVSDRVRKVNYCYPIVPNRAGQGARVLAELAEAGISCSENLRWPRDPEVWRAAVRELG